MPQGAGFAVGPIVMKIPDSCNGGGRAPVFPARLRVDTSNLTKFGDRELDTIEQPEQFPFNSNCGLRPSVFGTASWACMTRKPLLPASVAPTLRLACAFFYASWGARPCRRISGRGPQPWWMGRKRELFAHGRGPNSRAGPKVRDGRKLRFAAARREG